jgi:hypothetical protein
LALVYAELATSKAVLGASHPNTLTYTNNLAELYRSQGKHDKAANIKKQKI